jgi:2-polyprenyl-3-methyl-5-hydroxy-6-metoxy-1,4-benzoquinol methylase
MGIHFHSNKDLYFQMQHENAASYVIPFIEEKFPLHAEMRVLEIGCAEGGVLLAFLDRGLSGVGVELSESRAALAKGYLAAPIEAGQAEIISRNIYDPVFQAQFKGQFDLIVLKDVIEHIPDQAKIMAYMKEFLRPNGQIYFGFPPWMMPYGGHQQVCRTKVGKLPWLHLLPQSLYRWILVKIGEQPATVTDLMEVYDTRLTLERFERFAHASGFEIAHKRLYLVNPIYRYKFKLKPRVQWKLFAAIPWFRNFVTTCGYYSLRVKD